MVRKKSKKIFIIIFIVLVWLNNTSLFSKRGTEYKFLAHRGLAQVFDESKTDWNSNTAAMIEEPVHDYIENTIPSMRAAFDLGAAAVEFDVKLSKDGKLAVFHDSNLLYRCVVEGEVQDYTMDELRGLDIGYGYTADGGVTYLLRGKGVGLMPTMNEVLDTFPDKEFIIEVKDGKIETYKVLWENLSYLPEERQGQVSIVCAVDTGAKYLKSHNLKLKVMSKSSMITALCQYELISWTGYIPKSIRNTDLRLPLKYAKFLWGWPHKFMERMETSGTRVEVTAGGLGTSEGFDTIESLNALPEGFTGFIWTNRIDLVNPGTIKK